MNSLRTPVDIASLAVFRVLFGCVMAIAAVRYLSKGWVTSQLTDPPFHFTYPYFDFVRPWPEPWMHVHLGVLVLAAVLLAIGYRSQLAAAVLAAGWAYVELIDRATYLNHYYLVCLLALLLAVAPCGAACSLDARLHPERSASTMPRWILLAFQLQVAVVYVFAGLAKLNADWLLRAQPLRIWLAAASGRLSWLEPLLAQPAAAFVASWLGAAFDLCIVPLLLWRRSRRLALIAALSFHVATGLLLPIGMFPWIMLVAATLLLPADWPRAWLGAPRTAAQLRTGRVLPLFAAVHCAVQLLIPLHHHGLVRDSAWTHEGFDFAWKVMLVEKSGSVRYMARDRASGERWAIEPAAYLTPLQALALGRDPQLIADFARHLRSEHLRRTGRDIAVYAEAFASLNGRPARRLVDASLDLTRTSTP